MGSVEKSVLDKKRIIWKNPMNGFAIAAFKDIDYEITLPNSLPTFEENYSKFKSLWMALDQNLDILYENIERMNTAALIAIFRLLLSVLNSTLSLIQSLL